MDKRAVIEGVTARWKAVCAHSDERMRRLMAAAEAQAIGHGGITLLSTVTGLSRKAIRSGIADLALPPLPAGRVRRKGGGRKPLVVDDPTVIKDLESMVEPTTKGDPMSPLRWTLRTTTNLAEELQAGGHQVSPTSVRKLLKGIGYSLQVNRKSWEGTSHEDRDAQFNHINEEARRLQQLGQPVISIDAKKKELIGNFKNAGAEWRPEGDPSKVNVYDFRTLALGKATPYGIYDVGRNEGWVSVGVDHDTAEFAVASIGRWWTEMGKAAYPAASELMITADCGGSNGYRLRLWKVCLQRLADETGLAITVCHYPPGTSKWNKIEHRLFAHITRTWPAQPLQSFGMVVDLIGSTKTKKGLTVRAALDTAEYPTGIQVTDEQLKGVQLKHDEFHGERNYAVAPIRNF